MAEPAADTGDLARRLLAMAEAFDRARALGLPVSVPEELFQACLAIVDRHEGGQGPGRGTSRAGDTVLADVPLRKAVWQVISPDERFTVTDVTERLASLGVEASASQISNALGYWVKAQRLIRERKGLYLCPLTGKPGAASRGPASTPKRKESPHEREPVPQKKAV